MHGDTPPQDGDPGPDRRTLVRDIAVLQVKLVVDGLRDFILVPISLVAGLLSLIRTGDRAGSAFYRLLRIGRRTDRWINLFGAADRAPGQSDDELPFPDEDIDTLVCRLEAFVVEEYRDGGVTQQARDRLGRAIESLSRLTSRRREQRR